MELDNMDLEILNLLQEDSSTPFVEIAEKMGVTDGTIHQRIKKLKKAGVIKRFTVQLDQELIRGDSLVYLLVTVNPGYLESVSKEVSTYRNVLEVHEVHTQGDLLIKVRASSQEEVRDIVVNQIRKIEGVVTSNIFPVYKVWKEENNPPLPKNLFKMG